MNALLMFSYTVTEPNDELSQLVCHKSSTRLSGIAVIETYTVSKHAID